MITNQVGFTNRTSGSLLVHVAVIFGLLSPDLTGAEPVGANPPAPAPSVTAMPIVLGLREAERVGNFELIGHEVAGTVAIQRAEISSRLDWRLPANFPAGWYQAACPATSRFQAIAQRHDENEPFLLTVSGTGDASAQQSSFAYKVSDANEMSLSGLPGPLLTPSFLQEWRSSQPVWLQGGALVRLEVRRPLLMLGDIKLHPVPANACVSLQITGDAPYNMFTDDQPVRFTYELRNHSGQPFRGVVRFTLRDAVDGSDQIQQRDVSIAAEAVIRGSHELKPRFGAYRLTVETLAGTGGVLYSEQRHFTYSPAIEVKALPESWPVGFHRSPSEPDMVPPVGAKWVRVWGGWGGMEPEPGRYDWTLMDRNVAMARKYGHRLLWVCHGVPRWSLPENDRDKPRAGAHYAPVDIEQIRPFLRAFWNRYAPTGVFGAVEIGNEPNAHPGWSPVQYAQMARAIYEETHRAAGQVRVIGISMSGGLHIRYMEEALRAGLRTSMDIASLHIYEVTNPIGDRSVEAKIRGFKETLRAHGLEQMPVWNTESGVPMDIRQDGLIVPQEELNRQFRQHPSFDPGMPWRVEGAWRGGSELLSAAWSIRASYQQFAAGVEKNFLFAWSGSPHFSWVHDSDAGGNPMPKISVVSTAVMSLMLKNYGPAPTPEQPAMDPVGDWLVFAHRFSGPRGGMTVVYVHPSGVNAGSGDQVAALALGDDRPVQGGSEAASPWMRSEAPKPVRVALKVSAPWVIVTDMLGRERQRIQAVNGMVTISATEIPHYVLEEK